MTRHKQKPPKGTVFRIPRSEPLRSTRRDDGLWESVETDDNQAPTAQPRVYDPAIGDGVEVYHIDVKQKDTLGGQRTKSVGVQTSPPPVPTKIQGFPKEPSELAPGQTNTAIGPNTETPPLAILPSSVNNVVDAATNTLVAADAGIRRRRGRPRNPTGFRNRRSVRFSDPIASECEAELISRDSHVFVRLLKVVVELEQFFGESATKRRQEYSWNNRGKGWRADGRRSDEGLVEIADLFRLSPGAGVDLYPVVLPTERGGVRQSVNMAWDEGRACFLGVNQDGETLSVTLGEMKDMARDPWARQFVGYIMS